jgi:CRISPR-associated protein Cmr4
MSQAAALLVLRAHTGIHAGVGQEVGTVDLPIQRERITNFPVVRGPSLKGALRQAAAEAGLKEKAELLWLFGPETSDADKFGGALSVADARLVLFPMRSLRGTFAWLTCPFALERLRRDLGDSKLATAFPLDEAPTPRKDMGLVCQGSQVTHQPPGQNRLPLVVVENHGVEVGLPSEELTALAGQLTKLHLDAAELKARLAVVEDELFANLVTFGTEVVTRVHLDDVTKTVRRGQLWTEELLPAESVIAALLVCHDAREKDKTAKAMDLLKALTEAVKGRFQIGGNETVGYGVCHASWVGPVALSGGNGNGGKKGGK